MYQFTLIIFVSHTHIHDKCWLYEGRYLGNNKYALVLGSLNSYSNCLLNHRIVSRKMTIKFS